MYSADIWASRNGVAVRRPVLILNGLHLVGIGDNRDISVFNFLTGGITLLIALWWAFGGAASVGGAFDAAGTLLFSFTYL